jgi:hypothetical protein
MKISQDGLSGQSTEYEATIKRGLFFSVILEKKSKEKKIYYNYSILPLG